MEITRQVREGVTSLFRGYLPRPRLCQTTFLVKTHQHRKTQVKTEVSKEVNILVQEQDNNHRLPSTVGGPWFRPHWDMTERTPRPRTVGLELSPRRYGEGLVSGRGGRRRPLTGPGMVTEERCVVRNLTRPSSRPL